MYWRIKLTLSRRNVCLVLASMLIGLYCISLYKLYGIETPHRILLDTDVDTDDLFAFTYLLKLNKSEFALEAVTISANAWSNAGHAVNQLYDILYMMGRDDIPVGVGGDGGILDDGTILPDVGGYLPIIEQGNTTAGRCRYRQTIPVGSGGRPDVDTNFGIRKAFLPQGSRKYSPLQQPTAQQVMIDKISAGPITVFLTGTLTNFAIFLMSNPHLKKNVKSIYIMGGGVRSSNPNGCKPRQCRGPGNLYTDYMSNPYSEYNMFADPFAAYQVIHSGIPITLVPLDATNTIPITKQFFETFEQNQHTVEAQYCFQSLKMARSDFMWDQFAIGIAISIMRNSHDRSGENEFAEMEYMNITVVTSNPPYGTSDSSNPFFNGRKVPKFNLTEGGVHSGHVQTGLQDPFCFVPNGNGRCKDGYTEEVKGSEGVRVLVATKAKPNPDPTSNLTRAFFKNFLDVLNNPQQAGEFNFTTQFPNYKAVFYNPDFDGKKLGRPVIFDMDMSPGDFLALFYLLKVPVEMINIKAIIVSPTGWANAATIDVVYDLLHMMGRDDIPVGLGENFPYQSDAAMSGVGDCKYIKVIPHGSGGFLDSDTLYGLARNLPRSTRRYIPKSCAKNGSLCDKEQLELGQPQALEVWESIVKTLDPRSKVTILTNGPLTNLAKIILSNSNSCSLIQDIYIVGGHISQSSIDKGNVITISSNKYTEMNMFLDPLAAKIVFESSLNITLVPLGAQRGVSSYATMLDSMKKTNNTPEALFSLRLLSRLAHLQQTNHAYHHMEMFLGEILGAVILGTDNSSVYRSVRPTPIKIIAEGIESEDGRLSIDEKEGKLVGVVEKVDSEAYYHVYATQLGIQKQSAVIGSFNEQKKIWSKPN